VSCPSQSIGLTLTVCPASEASSRLFDTILLLSSSFSVSSKSVASLVRPPCPERFADPQGTHYATPLTVIQFLQRSIRSLAFCWVSGTERCFACPSPGQSCSGLSGCGAIQGHQEAGGHRHTCDTRPYAHRLADFVSLLAVQPAASCGLRPRLIARCSRR